MSLFLEGLIIGGSSTFQIGLGLTIKQLKTLKKGSGNFLFWGGGGEGGVFSCELIIGRAYYRNFTVFPLRCFSFYDPDQD